MNTGAYSEVIVRTGRQSATPRTSTTDALSRSRLHPRPRGGVPGDAASRFIADSSPIHLSRLECTVCGAGGASPILSPLASPLW